MARNKYKAKVKAVEELRKFIIDKIQNTDNLTMILEHMKPVPEIL